MANPAKKMTLDPFVLFPVELHELIYQHMKGQQVLNAFLVSNDWKERTSVSPAAMSKIKLKYYDKLPFDTSLQEITALLNSQRRYRNFQGSFFTNENAAQKLLLLKTFAPTLVSLQFLFLHEELSNEMPMELNLPKLQTFVNFGYVGSSILLDLKNSENLESLTIQGSQINEEVMQMLMGKKKLKELAIFGFNSFKFYKFFTSEECKFKLKSLTCESVYYNRLKFETFLLHSADTLTSLAFYSFSQKDFQSIKRLPALTNFEYHDDDDETEWDFDLLEPNTSIKMLKIGEFSGNRKILELFKAVEDIKVQSMKKDDFEWIVRNMPKLKNLKLERWIVEEEEVQTTLEEIKEIYEKLKVDPTVNQEIEVSV